MNDFIDIHQSSPIIHIHTRTRSRSTCHQSCQSLPGLLDWGFSMITGSDVLPVDPGLGANQSTHLYHHRCHHWCLHCRIVNVNKWKHETPRVDKPNHNCQFVEQWKKKLTPQVDKPNLMSHVSCLMWVVSCQLSVFDLEQAASPRNTQEKPISSDESTGKIRWNLWKKIKLKTDDGKKIEKIRRFVYSSIRVTTQRTKVKSRAKSQ